MALPEDERWELVEALMAAGTSPDSRDEEIEAAWDAEASRRVEDILAGRVVGHPVEELLEELRRRYP